MFCVYIAAKNVQATKTLKMCESDQSSSVTDVDIFDGHIRSRELSPSQGNRSPHSNSPNAQSQRSPNDSYIRSREQSLTPSVGNRTRHSISPNDQSQRSPNDSYN